MVFERNTRQPRPKLVQYVPEHSAYPAIVRFALALDVREYRAAAVHAEGSFQCAYHFQHRYFGGVA